MSKRERERGGASADRAETRLRLLLSKQRTAIDEIKKATNYDSTRKLIEQYDEAGGPQVGGQLP